MLAVVENARLETIQIRINIENVIKRANDSISRGQPGTAIQLLRKGNTFLATKNDAYSNQAKENFRICWTSLIRNAAIKMLKT